MATRVGAACCCRVCRSLATTARDESCCTRPDRRLRSPWSCSWAGWTHSCYEQSSSRPWVLKLWCTECTLQDEHLRGTWNFEAEALRRLTRGSSVPVCLQHVPRVHPPVWSDSWFWTRPTPRNFVICELHLTRLHLVAYTAQQTINCPAMAVASQFCEFKPCGQGGRAKMGAKALYPLRCACGLSSVPCNAREQKPLPSRHVYTSLD